MKEPDQVITRRGDGTNNPYMLRWFLFRSKRDWMPRLYLHKFLRSDDDRAPHDHPWWFVSLILWGSYIEHRWIDGVEIVRRRRAPSIAYRPLSTRHRVELIEGWYDLNSRYGFKPVWTLILTGSDVRAWGFWCREHFIPWRQFDGCGE
jgi:hypothetical protein